MKERFFSRFTAGMLCVCVLFSALAPVKEVSAREASAREWCEHMTPPKIVEINEGIQTDSTSHWKQYTTKAICNRCGEVLDIVSVRIVEKGNHNFDLENRCIVCGYERKQ